MTARIVSKLQRPIQRIGVKFTHICATIICQWPFNPHHHKYRETANLLVTRVHRSCANHRIWEHAPFRANFADFAIGAIVTCATEHTTQSIVKRSGANEGKVLVRSRMTSGKTRFLETVQMIMIYFLFIVTKTFNIPSISSVSPLKVDNLTLQLCCHPDRQKVDYVLNGFVMDFASGSMPRLQHLNLPRQTVHLLCNTRP